MQNGFHKIFKLFFLSIFIFTINLSAQEINVTPLINLDEIQPSYDEEILILKNFEELEDYNFDSTINESYDDSFATISLLNKITADVKTVQIKLKHHYLFEELKIYAIDCYNSEPLEKKETAVYLNVYNDKSSQRIFNGWMIKSLPSISSMEHPIYDLWVDDCFKL